MLTSISAFFSWLAGRFRSRVELELEVVALRHQVAVLHRQRPGRPRFWPVDRLRWVWLYRVWPRCLDVMVLVKPATVVQCTAGAFGSMALAPQRALRRLLMFYSRGSRLRNSS